MKKKDDIRDYIFGTYKSVFDTKSRVLVPYQLRKVFGEIKYVVVFNDDDSIRICIPQTIPYMVKSYLEENGTDDPSDFFSKGRFAFPEVSTKTNPLRFRLTELDPSRLAEKLELAEDESIELTLESKGDYLLLDKGLINKVKSSHKKWHKKKL